MIESIQWLTLPGPPEMPLWQRQVGIDAQGVVYVPTALGGDEDDEQQRADGAGIEGIPVAVHLDHPYAPASWMAQRCPKMAGLCAMIAHKARTAAAAHDTTITLLRWIAVPDAPGTRTHQWQRTFGISIDQTVYCAAAIAGTEDEIVAKAKADDIRVVIEDGHAYVPLSWLASIQPHRKQLLEQIEADIRRRGKG